MVERLTLWQKIINRFLLATGSEPWFYPRVYALARIAKQTL